MPIPDYQEFMLPLLRAVADGKGHKVRDLVGKLADQAELSPEERQELLPSGQQTVVGNRVGWAKTYLKKAGLLTQPARGFIRITPEGTAALAKNPAHIDTAFLQQYPSFVAFLKKGHGPRLRGEAGRPRLLPRRGSVRRLEMTNQRAAVLVLQKGQLSRKYRPGIE